MAVPYTFGSATTSIPLSQLDSNFATTITLGNTAIQLGNTVTTLNNMTFANVTVSSGNVTATNVTATNVTSPLSTALTLQSNAGNTAVTIDTSQNVGIGTTSPTATGGYDKALDVVGGANGAGIYVRGSTNPSTVYGAIQYDNSSNRTNINAIGTNNFLRFVTVDTERVRINSSGSLSFANTTDTGAYNAVLGYRNNHFMGQRSNTVATGTTSTMLTLVFGLNGAAIVRVVDSGTVNATDYFTNVYEYFVTCYNGTVTATLKQSQIGSGLGSHINTSTSSSTFNVIQTGDASQPTMHDTAVDVLACAAGNFSHATVSITMAANN